MSNIPKRIENLESKIKELNPAVIIGYIQVNNNYLCFGNLNESENLGKCIKFVFENAMVEQKFNYLIELECYCKLKFKDFILLNLESYIKEIENDFKQQ